MVVVCDKNTSCVHTDAFYSKWKWQGVLVNLFFLTSVPPFSTLRILALKGAMDDSIHTLCNCSLALSCFTTEQSRDRNANTNSNSMILAWFFHCCTASIMWKHHSIRPLFLTFMWFLIPEGFDGKSWEVGRLCLDRFLNTQPSLVECSAIFWALPNTLYLNLEVSQTWGYHKHF